MDNKFNSNYIKIITKLVDTSKFPVILCTINSDAKNLFQFPKIIHCNALFEKTFNKKFAQINNKDFDSIINFDFPENEYIKFIKKIKVFKRTMVKAKLQTPEGKQYFAISFHPLPFMSTVNTKYCLFDYISIHSMNENPADIYDVLENIKDNFDRKPSNKVNDNAERILNNENFLNSIYEAIERNINIRQTLNKITAEVADYLKANRVVIHIYDSTKQNIMEHFAEYNDKGLPRFLDDKLKKHKEQYLVYINKLIEQRCAIDNSLKILQIKSSDKSLLVDLFRKNLENFKIKSQIIIEDTVQNNICVRVYIHQAYIDKDWPQDEIDLINRIIERLSLIIEKNVNIYKLKQANQKLKENTKKLKTALEQEQKARKVQTEFIAMVSHQFRTPLQIIEGTRSILQRKINQFKGLNKTQLDSLQPLMSKIKNAVVRMDTLINKTLDLSNIDTTGDINYYPTHIDIKSIILECINRVIPNPNDVRVEASLDHLPDIFFADGKLLEHAFGNIIENAVKYSKKGGVVEIQTEMDSTKFIVSIQDHGVGIPKDDQEKIFQKFVRGQNVQTMNGTGIGLFLVKKFVEKHGGTITLKSKENEGTTFFLTFPFKKKN